MMITPHPVHVPVLEVKVYPILLWTHLHHTTKICSHDLLLLLTPVKSDLFQLHLWIVHFFFWACDILSYNVSVTSNLCLLPCASYEPSSYTAVWIHYDDHFIIYLMSIKFGVLCIVFVQNDVWLRRFWDHTKYGAQFVTDVFTNTYMYETSLKLGISVCSLVNLCGWAHILSDDCIVASCMFGSSIPLLPYMQALYTIPIHKWLFFPPIWWT